MPPSRDELATALRRFHAEVDGAASLLMKVHRERLHCARGCSSCCVDELTVFEVEAARIREQYPEVLEQEPGPVGACAMLDEHGGCRVYGARPYVCRTQGIPLRWFGADDEGNPAEYRDICPLNEEGLPLEDVAPDACWLLGPYEDLLARIQAATGRPGVRVPLRGLFGS